MKDTQPPSPKADSPKTPSSPTDNTPSSPKQASLSSSNPEITPKQVSSSSSSTPEITPPTPQKKVSLTIGPPRRCNPSKQVDDNKWKEAAKAASLPVIPSTPKTPRKTKPSWFSSQGSSSINTSSSSSSYCSTLIKSLVEFAPVKIRIDNLDNYYFYKVVLWMKSAHEYKRLNLSLSIADWPPLGIHGFFPVFVSPGAGNKIVPGKHKRRNEKDFIDDHISVIKPELESDIKIYWHSLHKKNSTESFLKRQAWKHNWDVGMFPDDKDFIEKGLEIGKHFIKKISNWTKSMYTYDTDIRYECTGYRDALHAHLQFTTDCRFQLLEYQPTLYGLKKIGMMGILNKKLPKQWNWNPVDIEVDESFLRGKEKPTRTDKFILETLKRSIQKRKTFYNKRPLGVESSEPNKRLQNI